MFGQPKAQMLFNLVAHASGMNEALFVIPDKFCRIVKRPVIVSPHVEKNSGTILLGIGAHREDMREDGQPAFIDLGVPEERDEDRVWPTLTPAGVEPEVDQEAQQHRSNV